MYEFLKAAIAYRIGQGERNFVIYPYGGNGKLVKQILNQEFGISEQYIVDNLLCETVNHIFSVDYLRQDYLARKDFKILMTANYRVKSSVTVHQQIADFATVDRMVDLCSPSSYFNPWNHFGAVQMDWDIRHSTAECISREIYRNDIAGAVAEAGVYKGNTAKRLNLLFPDRKLYLFDTFCGFDTKDQERDERQDRYNMKLDFSDTSKALVLSKMSFPQNCVIKKGWFPQSAESVEDTFAFVRLDMDLYHPTYSGLEFFYPRMSRGGFITVHDCRSKNFDGARDALLDFVKKYHLNYMCMPDELGTAVIPIGY